MSCLCDRVLFVVHLCCRVYYFCLCSSIELIIMKNTVSCLCDRMLGFVISLSFYVFFLCLFLVNLIGFYLIELLDDFCYQLGYVVVFIWCYVSLVSVRFYFKYTYIYTSIYFSHIYIYVYSCIYTHCIYIYIYIYIIKFVYPCIYIYTYICIWFTHRIEKWLTFHRLPSSLQVQNSGVSKSWSEKTIYCISVASVISVSNRPPMRPTDRSPARPNDRLPARPLAPKFRPYSDVP